ncbi:MAG: S41 family peptidase [Gemmatimonadetes bacterium]|nr:S41 family peptidase [Gemmatimonadota bacterium]
MKLRRSTLAPAAVLTVAVLTGGWFLQQGVDEEQNVYVQVRLFQEVVDHIASQYVEDVDRGRLYQSAIEGLIGELGDPNTSFLQASDYEDLRIRTQGDYGGVGLEITERDGYVTVVAPIQGTPGARAGIRSGDQFVEIAGQPAEGWSSDQAVEVLRGEAGSEVDVKVRRLGVDQPIEFTLERARIHLRSVPFAMDMGDGIAYVPLDIVRESSSQEVRTALDSLRADGATRGLILDVRSNPGGLLEQGIALSDMFLERGAAIVETRGRAVGQNETFSASSGERYEGVPIVVLVDEYSASASEIIAGALQDHDRALVVGVPSFGKGSVQTLFRLTGGNVLRLTTARWYTPAGRSIAKDHEEDLPGSQVGTLTLGGVPTSIPDLEDRPTVQSMGGRTLYGGGGITPDVIIMADTLTTDEQRAVRGLYRQAGAFNNALFRYAVRYIQEHPDLSPGFRLEPGALDGLYATLPDYGIDVERETFDAAARYVRYQLESEIGLQKWSDAGEFRARMAYDRQLQRALEILRRADSTEGLFRVASADAGAVARQAAGAPAAGGR